MSAFDHLQQFLQLLLQQLKHPEYSYDFAPKEKTPWQMAALPFFIVSLLGWMPAPIEISAINPTGLLKRKRFCRTLLHRTPFSTFNVGYIWNCFLLAAVFFVALGALIHIPTGQAVEAASAKYISQFVGMYASVLENGPAIWSRFIAFPCCIFGTVITVIDGYSRVNCKSAATLNPAKRILANLWTSGWPSQRLLSVTSSSGSLLDKFPPCFALPWSVLFAWQHLSSLFLNYVLVTRENKNLPS